MSTFTFHDMDSAPEASKPLLENSLKNFGMIPNLHAVLAESPHLLKAYQQLHALFQDSSFNNEELTVIWQTINVEHKCRYCVPAHTMIANKMGVDPRITEALRNGSALPDSRLQALHDTTLALVRNRGILSQQELTRFFDAGFTRQQLLEVVLGISQKVISNYVNHLAETPLDAPFKEYEW